MRDSLLQDLKNLHGLKNSLDTRRFTALAKRIYEARRIVILDGDLSAALVEYFGYHLILLGLPVFTVTSSGRITHTVRVLGKQDLVVAITFRRGLLQTVEGVQQARAHGAYCVGVSDTYVSPLARECNEVFLATIGPVSTVAHPGHRARNCRRTTQGITLVYDLIRTARG